MEKILVIDDEKMVRQSIRDYFEDQDYDVILAGDGQEGLDLFQSEGPDAIFVDLNMPRVDGFKVIEVVSRDTPETPIIVVSGVGIVKDAIKAVRLGAWDFITKPINDLEILSYTLEKVSERARLIRENREYKESLEIKVKERTSELNKANVSLRHLQMQIILRLARAGEYRDNETGRHVIRVSKYAEVISKKLGLLPEKVELIKRTSSLHDIGKIGVPDNILLKPGKLDEKEWEIMKEHCRYGYNILSVNEEKPDQMENDLSASLKIPENFKLTGELLDCACNIALYHHEKWDGSGYLLGLKCDKIPLEARITALADVYDALGSSRTYKKPFSEEKCQSIVRELSGSHFDPKIVAVFFESIETIKDIKTRWKD